MSQSLPLRCGVFMAAVVLMATSVGTGEVLDYLTIPDVSTTYTYPNAPVPGLLNVSEQGVGVVATLADQTTIKETVMVMLSLNLVEEVGDPNDPIAHGRFDGGVLSLVAAGPVIVFQADIVGLQLFEVNGDSGSFEGLGTFENAVCGGVFGGITMPGNGDVFGLLFTWYSDPQKLNPVNLENYTTSRPPGTTVYGDLTMNILPEPSTLLWLALIAPQGWARRQCLRQ